MKPLKIMRVITRLNVGGPSIQAIDLSCDTPQWTTRLISGSLKPDEQSMLYYIKNRSIDHRHLTELVNPINPLKDHLALFKLIQEIRLFKPQLIHSHHAKAGILARIAGQLCGVPVIHTFHGNVFQGHFSPLKSQFIKFSERSLAPFSEALIAISEKQRSDLCDLHYISERDRIHLIPLGFHLKRFFENSLTKENARKQLDLPQNKKLIGIIGRLTSVKNHSFFLENLKSLEEKYHGVIVGDGELKNNLIKKSQRLGLNDRLHWFKTTETIENVYPALDLLTIPSLSEGTPVTMIEAMASGVPVVAARVGGIPDLADNESNALLYEPGHLNDFSEKILLCLKDSAQTALRTQEAKKYAIKHHSFDSLVNSLDSLYHKILS